MELKEQLISKLEETFGPWEKVTSKFGSTSFGEIADMLCLSGSLFSKLISGSATEGMYIRSLKNVERIKIQTELEHQLNEQLHPQQNLKSILTKVLGLTAALFIGLTIGYYIWQKGTSDVSFNDNSSNDKSHFLSAYFDLDYKSANMSPYLDQELVQDYCPCAAYEGKWELAKSYLIPIPYKKSGLYYFAKASDIRFKCSRNTNNEDRGKVLYGFEMTTHELWMDSEHRSLAPQYFDTNTKSFTKDYYNLDFANNARFEKVAEIKSFMLNTFTFENDMIVRKAEPAGRYASNINDKNADKYEVDIKNVLEDIIGDMVKTNCSNTQNAFCNPNSLIEGESTISFNCDFTIDAENLGIGGSYPYTKQFKLIDQNYSNNLLCACESI